MGMMEAGLRTLLETLCAPAATAAPKPAGRRPRARRPFVLALEPRFLFDAAGMATAAQVAQPAGHPAAQAPDPIAKALADHVLPADPTATVSAPTQVRAADPAQTGGKKEVAFVDTSVADYQTLVAGVRAGVEVELIDSRQSGLAQIAKWAETHSGYDTVHVLSHGAEASLTLGTDTITEASLATPTVSVELAEIGHAMNSGGDLLLYGCNVAKGADGRQFVADIATDTGLTVAASDNPTGTSRLGADWTLEYSTDAISSTALDISNYDRYLTLPNSTQTFSGYTGSGSKTVLYGFDSYPSFVGADNYFILTANTGNLNADSYGAFVLDRTNAGAGGISNYLDVKVKTGSGLGSFQLSSASIGEYYDAVTSPHNAFSNVYVAVYANGTLLAQTGAITDGDGGSSATAAYTINYSSIANKTIDEFRVYYTADSGTNQTAFNLVNFTVANASASAPSTGPTQTVTINSLSADTGTSATDFITKTASQTISATLSGALGGTDKLYGSVDGGSTWTDITTKVSGTTVTWTGATLNSGTSSIEFKVTDSSNNDGTVATHAYTLDTTAPAVTAVTLNATAYKLNDTVTVTVNTGSYDGNGAYTLDGSSTVDGAALTGWNYNTGTHTATATFTVLGGTTEVMNGTVAVNIVVTDAAGNSSGAYTTAIAGTTIDAKAPTDISVSSVTCPVTANSQAGTFTATDPSSGTEAFTYALVAGSGGNDADNGKFSISGNTLSVGGAALNDGTTYHIYVQVTDRGGNSFNKALTLTAADAPSVSSINLAATQVTKGSGGLDYTVTFNQAVDNVDPSDFSVAKGAGVTGSASVSVTAGAGGSSTYTVHVAGLGGDGTVELDLNGSGTGIVAHTGGAAISGGYTSGQTYTLDNTGPTLAITSDVSALKIGGTATLTFTFSEAPTGFTQSDVTVSNGTLSAFAVTGDPKVYTATFTPTASLASGNASITVGGASYTDAAGNDGGAGTTPAIAIDTLAPTVSSVSVPTNGTYKVGDTLSFTVNTGEAVTVTGTPRVALTIGSTTQYATYASGSGTSALVFHYTVQSGDLDTDGIALGALGQNGGSTLKDAAGNDMTLTLNSPGSTASVNLDGVAPTVSSVSVPANGTYKTGDALQFTVNWSEAVTVDTSGGTPYLPVTLDTGGVVHATYVSGSGTTALVFSYIVASGNLDTNGIAVGAAVTSSGGTLKDAAGNSATLTLNSVGGTGGVDVDGVAPAVGSVSVPSNATYKTGDTLDFTVNWSETVTVTGTPNLAITLDTGGTVYASYLSGSGSAATVFRYTVQSGTLDSDGVAVGALALNSGTIKDAAGNDATLTLNSVGATANVKVDGAVPTYTAVTRSNLIVPSGASGTFTVTYADTGSGVDAATIATGNVTVKDPGNTSLAVTAASWNAGTNTATYTFTAPGGSWDIGDMGSYTISLNGNSVKDLAGNALAAAANAKTFSVVYGPTITAPNIAISGHNGLADTYKTGDTVTATWNNGASGNNNGGVTVVTFDFSQFGGGTAVAGSNSGGVWSASYTITAGSIDATNRNVSVSATDTNGTSTVAGAANALVDDQAPTVTAGKISFSGGSGTDGAFKIGDTVTASWDNGGSGDNNGDTLSSVTFDLSQFGGGTAVAATRSGGTWSAAYTVTAGSIDASGRTATVTVVDDAGNSVVRTSGATATVDSIAPTVGASRVSLSGASGLSGAFKIGDTVTATWNNSSGGDNNSDAIGTVYFDLSQFGGGTAVRGQESGGVWSASYTITAGSIDAVNRNVTVTVTDHVGNSVVRTGNNNATVDSIAPKLSSGGISLSGATGADGGIFKIGDVVTATWNATSSGDNDPDAMSSVKVDFSQFGGGTAVSASNSNGVWTARYTVTAGSLDASSTLNVSVTATDNAGNVTTVAGTGNARADNQRPDAPAAPVLSSASDTGFSDSDAITKVTTPTFTGSAEPRSTITVYDTDGRTVLRTTTTNGSGDWSITPSAELSAGSHSIRLTATDPAGNVSNVSTGTTIIVETRAPTLIDASLKASPGADAGTTVGVVSANDPGGQALRYQLTDDYGGHFAIDQTTGKVTIANPIDADTTAKSFQITVRVTDAAGLYTDKVLTIQKGTTKAAQTVVTVIPTNTQTVATTTTITSATTSSSANSGGANGPGSSANTPTIDVGSVGSTDTGAGNSGGRLITTGSMNGGVTDTGAGNSGGRLITTSNMNSPSSGSSISNASSTGPSGGGYTVAATFSESVGGGGFGSSSAGFSFSGSGGFSSSDFSNGSSSGTGSSTGANPTGGSSITGGTGASSTSGANGFTRGPTGGTPSSVGAGTGTSGTGTPGDEPGTQPQQTQTRDGAPPQGTPRNRGPQGQGERGQQQGQPQQGRPQGQPAPEQGQPQGERGQQGQGNGQGGQRAPAEAPPHAYLFGPASRSFSDQLADAAGRFDRGRDALIEAVKSVASLIDRDAA